MIRRVWLALTALATCVPAVVQAQGGPKTADMVLTEKSAYLLMQPEIVAAPEASRLMWSPDGRYLILVRQAMRMDGAMLRAMLDKKLPQGPPPGQISISVWDVKEHRTDDVWKAPLGPSFVDTIDWMPGSSYAFAVVHQTVTDARNPGAPPQRVKTVLRINAGTATSKVVAELPDDGFSHLSMSPSQPLALLVHTQISFEAPAPGAPNNRPIEHRRDTVVAIRESGVPGREIDLPQTGTAFPMIRWAADGSPLVQVLVRPKPEEKKVELRSFALDVNTGKTTPAANPPERALAEPSGPLRLKTAPITAKEAETTRTVPALWLEAKEASSQPRTLAALNVQQAAMSPKGDRIAYVADGAAWTREIFPMSREEYENAIAAAERTRILSNAKQLGLGLLMYAADYDDTFPANGGDINGKITPYLKNDSLFDGFNYTYPGGPLSSIASPAETEIGFVTGPGGRAVIFADGHVKWRNGG